MFNVAHLLMGNTKFAIITGLSKELGEEGENPIFFKRECFRFVVTIEVCLKQYLEVYSYINSSLDQFVESIVDSMQTYSIVDSKVEVEFIHQEQVFET